VVAVVAVIVAVNLATASPATVHWSLAWGDDFAGPAGQAPAGWKFDVGYGIFGDGDVATLTNSRGNVGLDGHGGLYITAVGQGQSWTSARIQTDSSGFAAPAGGELMVTASIQQPDPAGGLGYWPAFWMLGPGTWPATGEIDIMEDVNASSQHSGALHCGNLTQHNSDGTTGPCHEYTGLSSGLQPCPECQTGYHTYTVIIDRRDQADQQIRWYLDGQEFYSVQESQVGTKAWTAAVDHGFSIILDLAIGGKYPDSSCHCTAPDAATTSGAGMSVKYVRVYHGTLS
jgi:beta-glucanase (GH16 family)